MTALGELWTPIPGFEGRWDVSSQGRVRSIPRRRTRGGLLTTGPNKRGYLSVGLGTSKYEMHCLVALAFLGPRPDGMEVRHLNGDRLDARLENLRYGTSSENKLDQCAHGTHRNHAKTHCPSGHAYTDDNVRRIPSRPNARYCRACERVRHQEQVAAGRARRATATQRPDYDKAWRP